MLYDLLGYPALFQCLELFPMDWNIFEHAKSYLLENGMRCTWIKPYINADQRCIFSKGLCYQMLQAVWRKSVVRDVYHFHVLVESDAAHQASAKQICEMIFLQTEDTKTWSLLFYFLKSDKFSFSCSIPCCTPSWALSHIGRIRRVYHDVQDVRSTSACLKWWLSSISVSQTLGPRLVISFFSLKFDHIKHMNSGPISKFIVTEVDLLHYSVDLQSWFDGPMLSVPPISFHQRFHILCKIQVTNIESQSSNTCVLSKCLTQTTPAWLR